MKPCHCQSKLGAASISKALLSTSAGGGGQGFGGWRRGVGGGGGGGDGFGVPSAGESTNGTFDSEVSASLTEDVIILDVGVIDHNLHFIAHFGASSGNSCALASLLCPGALSWTEKVQLWSTPADKFAMS